MRGRQTVAAVGEIAEGQCKLTTLAGKAVAVWHVGGEYYAIDDTCPHAGAPLSRGQLEGLTVVCPLHAWRFRLADGAWADNPKLRIACHKVHVIDGRVEVEVPPGGGES